MKSKINKYSRVMQLFSNKNFNRIIFISIFLIFVTCLIYSSYVNYQTIIHLNGMSVINWLKSYYWILLHHFSQPLNANTSWLYIGVPVILFFSWLKPAIKEQKIFSKAIACDFLWMFIHTLATLGMIYIFIQALESYLVPIFNVSNIHILEGVHPILEVLVGYLLIELLGWFNHLLRHKIPVLWLFHEVHHAQRGMNPFSLFRVHPVDYLIAEVIIFLPAMFFENTLGIILTYLVIARFQDALSHSNIKWNFGPLRFIFVTPQSHRVHHSMEPEFFDLNYGVTLCVWDRLFGTHSHTDHAYPDTGINDPNFPLENNYKAVSMPIVLLRQFIYPFQKAIKRYWS